MVPPSQGIGRLYPLNCYVALATLLKNTTKGLRHSAVAAGCRHCCATDYGPGDPNRLSASLAGV